MPGTPTTWALALFGGIAPALLWLWFWLKEDAPEHRPKKLLFIIFLVGMLSVFFVLPIEQYIQSRVDSESLRLILWAATEEIFKFLVVIMLLYKTTHVNEPIKWPLFFITGALGFAGLENALFLIKPLSLDNTAVSLLTGQLRFLGATLLHTVATGAIGIALGLSFNPTGKINKTYLFAGIFTAITLHSLFNFFIMKNSGGDFLKVFALLWVVTIIIMLLLEKLRRMSGEK